MTTTTETKPKSAWSALAEKIPRLLSRDNGTDSLNRGIRKNRPEKESYRYCLYVKRGQFTLPECMCIDEWIKAGGMPAPVVLEALCKGREKELRRRCETILRNGGQKFMKFKDSFHESRFERLVQTQQILDKTVLSAVFLLTADISTTEECVKRLFSCTSAEESKRCDTTNRATFSGMSRIIL